MFRIRDISQRGPPRPQSGDAAPRCLFAPAPKQQSSFFLLRDDFRSVRAIGGAGPGRRGDPTGISSALLFGYCDYWHDGFPPRSKTPARDGRARHVKLTYAGRTLAEKMRRRSCGLRANLVALFDEQEFRTMLEFLERVAGAMRPPGRKPILSHRSAHLLNRRFQQMRS
jgi:hypothetical protein